jgi:hypothetical protein
MDQSPLVMEEIDAAARFLGEFGKEFPVIASFWLKAGEEDSWYLYVASEQFNDQNMDVAYREVVRIAGEMCDPDFDPFRVKLIKPTNPLARAATDFLQLFPGRKPIRLRQRNFGGLGAEEIYLYPRPVPVS